MSHREKAMRGHSEKTAVYQPRTEPSRETNPAGILTLDLQPLELGDNRFLLFKPPHQQYRVMGAERTKAGSKASSLPTSGGGPGEFHAQSDLSPMASLVKMQGSLWGFTGIQGVLSIPRALCRAGALPLKQMSWAVRERAVVPM